MFFFLPSFVWILHRMPFNHAYKLIKTNEFRTICISAAGFIAERHADFHKKWYLKNFALWK